MHTYTRPCAGPDGHVGPPHSLNHTRAQNSSFLTLLCAPVPVQDLIATRRATPGATPLKLVLMSATLDAAAFAEYFGGCPGGWAAMCLQWFG